MHGINSNNKNQAFGYTSGGCPLFGKNFMQVSSLLFRACSFGRDHSELQIPRTDDGDAHLKMD